MPKRSRAQMEQEPEGSRSYKRPMMKLVSRPSNRYSGLTFQSRVPSSRIVKMRYVARLVRVLAAGVPSVYAFRFTDLYDPDYSGTGHQPLLHDTYATLYNHYMVLGAKMTVNFVNNGVSRGLNLCVYPCPDTSFTTDPDTAYETPGAKYTIIGEDNHKSLTLKYSKKAVFGEGRETALSALFGSSPSEQYFGVIHFFSYQAQDCDTIVTMDYVVKLTEPKMLPGS